MATGRERALRAWMVFVLAVGAFLRVAELWAPLSHDELSAIVRLRFDSFNDLIHNGVYPDGHPAGMQVLLWLWSRLAGTSAPLLRLPFTLLSVGALPLFYAVARRWYGRMPALAATTVLAFSQYAVYHAMPVRPYGTALFFVILTLHFWTRLCLEHRRGWGYAVGFALSAAVCAYLHYFSGLTVALLAVAGLFVADRDCRRRYLAACLVAVVLFAPHLGITRHQLFDLQGVGAWLGRPDGTFFVNYLLYLCHHSFIVLAAMVLAMVLVFDGSALRGRWRLMLMSLALFVLPMLAGYAYSRLVSPVLQYSVLIFSWPFLLLALAGFVGERHRWRPLAGCALMGLALLVSLFTTRRHYDVLQREHIATAASLADEARSRYGTGNVALRMRINPSMLDYYSPALAAAADTGGAPGADYVVTAKLHDDSLFRLMRQYPYVVEARMCTTTPVLLLGRHPADGRPWPQTTLKEGRVATGGEYTFLLDTQVSDISESRYFALVASASGADSTMQLVMETWVDDHVVDWRSVPLGRDAVLPLCQDLNIKRRALLKRSRIKVFILAPDGAPSDTVDYRISLSPSDKYRFALLEEI